MMNRSISEFSLARSSTDAFLLPSSLPSVALPSPNQSPIPLRRLCSLCGKPFSASSDLSSAFHYCLEFLSPNCQMSAKITKSANITLRLSIILSNIVGAPTFSVPARDRDLQQPPASRRTAPARTLNFQLLTSNRFSPLTPIIPAHTRRSPVSPIIPAHTQIQGGGGSFSKMCSSLTLLFSYDIVTKQLSTIVGAPTFRSE